eukprot:s934_g29.t1
MAWTLTPRDDGLLHVHRSEVVVDGQRCTETLVQWKGSESGSLKELSFELFPDRGVERLLALYRFKPCWTAPKVLQKLSELPQETLFVLAQLASGGILVLCPLATQSHGGGSVCSLRGSARGLDDFELVMLSTGGPRPLLLALELPSGAGALGHAAQLAAERCALQLGDDGCLRRRKQLPAVFRRWGWCSWDAHGVGVQKWQLEAMCRHRPAWMVLDDGWQEEVHSEEWRKWLHSPQSRFEAKDFDLADLARKLAEEKIQLLVWHTLLGYWGGVAPQRGYAVAPKRPWWPQGLRCECPGEVDVWEGDFSVLEEQDFLRFYNDFYASLAAAGVAGVKCDGQFLADLLLGTNASRALGEAHEAAATKHFGEHPPLISYLARQFVRCQCPRIIQDDVARQ